MSGSSGRVENGPTGDVATLYYAFEGDGTHNSFHNDVIASIRQAIAADDYIARERILSLWLDYFEGNLRERGARRLIDYLESMRVWRRFGDSPVYKTVDTPSLAFTALVDEGSGKVDIIALGMCYKYPEGGEEAWWETVILPRLRSM